jgi:hypothetical protein
MISAAVLCVFACAPVLDSPGGQEPFSVETEDGRLFDEASVVPRFRLSGFESGALPEVFLGLRLFEGQLSSYAESHLADGEVTASLGDRDVPLSVWMDGDALLAQPARFLDPGQTYTLAAVGLGALAELTVSSEPFRRLVLIWPKQIAEGGALVYCADTAEAEPLLEREASVTIAPAPGQAGRLRAGIGPDGIHDDRCVSLAFDDDLQGTFVVPPPALGDAARFLFDPTPVGVVSTPVLPMVSEATCAGALGPACASFDGDELVLTEAPDGAWALRGTSSDGHVVEAFVTEARGASIKVYGFEPNTEYALSAVFLDGLGRSMSGSSELSSSAPRPHVVINEVLSNPRGPEPASEWLELINAGAAAATLSGWSIEDGGGRTVLPDFLLEPGAFAIVVGRDYVATPDDVVPEASALPVVVERLGKSGLSNSGERLRLLNAEGSVVSELPPIAATEQGVSLARRDPWSPDVVESFGAQATLGATPGVPNVFSTE